MRRDDCLPAKIRLCPETSRPRPINLQDEPPSGRSAFVTVLLAAGAKAMGPDALKPVLAQFEVPARPLITAVSPEELEKLERAAAQTALRPLRSLRRYVLCDLSRSPERLDEFLAALRRLPEVEQAWVQQQASDPIPNPGNDTFSAAENFLDPAPTGIDARWVWTQPNGDGAGLHFIDLEQGWLLGHEDLPSPTLIFNHNRDGVGGYVGNHGAAVVGQVAGSDNTRGIIGIAPALASVRVSSHWHNVMGGLHVADALVAALAASPRPHLVLIEVQIAFLPVETDLANFDAIRLAVASGIIVVEAGGNGDNDLDAWTDGMGKRRLNRGSADFRESGAILVGAGEAALPHDRSDFSNFGSRVDCYAWGDSIVTAGYGDLAGSGNTSYTADFGGTSGASPIVSGAALLLQGLHLAANGGLLSPLQMRGLLAAPATGTPQGPGRPGHIGVMPNLRAIVETTLGLVPDVYLRDRVGDDGTVPSAGAISISPDVIVRPAPVADPNAAFGEGSGTENDETLGSKVEAGQDNHVYVRMRNRGAATATGTRATVYWSEVSTLVTPGSWHLIGTTAPIDVPAGDTLVVTSGLLWPQANLPPAGSHACFVAILDQAADPAPPLPGALDWDGFRNLVRAYNNITWRNFNVVDVDPDPQAAPAALDFVLPGSPDAMRVFDFEIRQQLPAGVKVTLEIPLALFAVLPKGNLPKPVMVRGGVQLPLPPGRSLPFCGVRLGAGVRHRCRFLVKGDRGLERGGNRLAIRQIFDGEEVGRVTWALRAKKS